MIAARASLVELACHTSAATATATAAALATNAGQRRAGRFGHATAAITARTSWSDGRSAASFSSIAATSRSSARGTSTRLETRGAGSVRCRTIRSAALSATNGASPVNISNSIAPSA